MTTQDVHAVSRRFAGARAARKLLTGAFTSHTRRVTLAGLLITATTVMVPAGGARAREMHPLPGVKPVTDPPRDLVVVPKPDRRVLDGGAGAFPVTRGGRPAKEAITAAHYAQLRKRLQASTMRPPVSVLEHP